MRREDFASTYFETSRSFTSHAKCTGKSFVSNRVIGPAPDSPAISASHDTSTVFPSGLTIPSPVTTTRRRPERTPPRLLPFRQGACVLPATQVAELQSLPRSRGAEHHGQQAGESERGNVRRDDDQSGRSCGGTQVVAADRPRHPEPEEGVAEQVHGDPGAERDGGGGSEVVRRPGDELLAADCEADDPGDDDVVDVRVSVPGEDRALRTADPSESP